jgi:hypothetical protein
MVLEVLDSDNLGVVEVRMLALEWDTLCIWRMEP